MDLNQYSFKSADESNYDNRSRSKKRKKNKYGRSCSEERRPKSKNGTRLNFCKYCRPGLAIRIHNKNEIYNEINDYI